MKRPISPRYVATILMLSGAMLAASWSDRRRPDSLAAPLDQVDKQIAGWRTLKSAQLDANVLKVLDPSSYLSRTYQKDNTQLDLFIAFYAQQRAGEAMHSPKHCLPGAGWEIWNHASAPVLVNGKQILINQYSIENSGRRMTMFYWYQSKSRIVASEYLVKILLVRDTLLTGQTGGSLVRIILPDAPGVTEKGVEFASHLIPQVERCLGR